MNTNFEMYNEAGHGPIIESPRSFRGVIGGILMAFGGVWTAIFIFALIPVLSADEIYIASLVIMGVFMTIGSIMLVAGIIVFRGRHNKRLLEDELRQNGRVTTATILNAHETFANNNRRRGFGIMAMDYIYVVSYGFDTGTGVRRLGTGQTEPIRIRPQSMFSGIGMRNITRGEILSVPQRGNEFIFELRSMENLGQARDRQVRIVFNERGSMILGFADTPEHLRGQGFNLPGVNQPGMNG
ncbi:MAG: hypothetical protein FWE16_01840 [Firmicutes bacterium]|nr:hypothetical protein [Bacillota bacterium]